MRNTVEYFEKDQIDNVPADLKKLCQWVCYKPDEKRDEKKRIFSPELGSWCSSVDPHHWTTFARAVKGMERFSCDGIALVHVKTLVPDKKQLPMELVALPRWIGWRYVDVKGKRAKRPRSAVTDIEKGWPKGSVDFEQAHAGVLRHRMDGLGFNPQQEDGFVFADFDDCVKDGVLDPAVQKWLDVLQGYTEVTPSGGGLRVVVKGTLPRNVTNHPLRDSQFDPPSSVELYAGGTAHFVTLTGQRFNGSGFNMPNRQAAIDKLLNAIGFDAKVIESEFEVVAEKASGETTEAAAIRYFERACDEAEKLTEGRYSFLVRVCYWLGRIVGSKPQDPRLTLENVESSITEAIKKTGWTELRHIKGQLLAGMRRPLTLTKENTAEVSVEIKEGFYPRAADEAEEALLKTSPEKTIYQRAGELVKPILLPEPLIRNGLNRPANTCMLEPVTVHSLTETLERIVEFYKWSKPTKTKPSKKVQAAREGCRGVCGRAAAVSL